MSVVLIFFAALVIGALIVTIIGLDHVLEEMKKAREHKREKDLLKEERVNKMLNEEEDEFEKELNE